MSSTALTVQTAKKREKEERKRGLEQRNILERLDSKLYSFSKKIVSHARTTLEDWKRNKKEWGAYVLEETKQNEVLARKLYRSKKKKDAVKLFESIREWVPKLYFTDDIQHGSSYWWDQFKFIFLGFKTYASQKEILSVPRDFINLYRYAKEQAAALRFQLSQLDEDDNLQLILERQQELELAQDRKEEIEKIFVYDPEIQALSPAFVISVIKIFNELKDEAIEQEERDAIQVIQEIEEQRRREDEILPEDNLPTQEEQIDMMEDMMEDMEEDMEEEEDLRELEIQAQRQRALEQEQEEYQRAIQRAEEERIERNALME